MGGKKKKVTIGYKYFMGLHMGICRGPIDALRQIRVGDKVAWTGKLSNNSSIFINQPKLFGGEEQEGGIEGTLDFMTGDKDQPRNARLSAMLGGLTSAFRGVATVFFDGLVCAMSPYPKEWSFLVQKTKAGWHGGECWYPEKCEIPFYEYEIDALQIEWKRTVNNPYKFNTPNDVASWMTAPESYELMSSGDVISYPAGVIGDVGLFWAFISAPNGVKNEFSLNVQVLFDDSGKLIGSSGVAVDPGVPPPPVTGYPRSQGVLVHIPKSSPGWSAWLCFACVDGKDIETGLPLGSDSNHRARVYAVQPAGFDYLAMNPAHILRRLYTDPSIGRGLPASRLDEDSWRAAADKFYAEGFGLCMKWARTGSIADFAAEVINHAGAVVYTSRRTGKIVLKAIRDDYDVNDLPLYTPDTGLLGFDDDEASAQTGGINEIVVNYKDPVEKTDKAVREKNLGAIMAAGGITISESVDYPGIPTEALARRVARRDLQAKSGFIKRFSVRLDRRGRDIMPGGVFRISDASRGIENMVLRAGRVEYGTITDGTITVTALQDVFGLPATVYRDPEENAYVPPDTTARTPELQAAMEAPYRDLVQAMSASDLAILAPDAGYLHAAAVRPTTLSQSFVLQTRVAPAAYATAADMAAFCPGGKLAAALDYLDTTAVLTDAQALDELQPGTAALIGGEIVRVDAVNVATATLTIARGCVDTVPAQHAAGTAVLCYDSWGGDDQTEYTSGVSVDAQLLTSTGAGQLSPSAAPVQSVAFDSRAARPYPPGDVKLNGQRYPAEIAGDLEITWAHRDRLLQADNLIDTLQPSVGPEPGTTYAVELYDGASSTLLHSETGIVATTAYVPSAAFDYDNRLELYSVRGGLESWQRQVRRFTWGARLWTPADLVVAPKVWLDDSTDVQIISGAVAQWASKGSLGGVFSQSAASARPVLLDAALGARRAVVFDGVDDALVASTGAILGVYRNAGVGWAFTVYARSVRRPGYQQVFEASSAQDPGVTRFGVGVRDDVGYVAARKSDAAGAATHVDIKQQADLEYHIKYDQVLWSSAQARTQTDGGPPRETLSFLTPGATDNTNSFRLTLGCNAALTGFSAVKIAAVIAGSGSLPAEAEIQQLEGWAAHRYGLTENLPSDHPYKHAPPTV